MTRAATLFAKRDAAARRLREIDAALDIERRRYSDAIGCRVPIRIEAFRLAVGASA